MKELLEKEYKKLESQNISPTGKVNLLNNIIQFKLNEQEFKKFNNDLSIDIKRYINSLVELAEKGARKYDIINEYKILELFNKVEYSDRINYLNYFIRTLEKSAFKEDIKKLQKLRYQTILEHSKKNIWNFKSILNFIIYYPLVSIFTLIITLIIITLITNVILLPAPFKLFEILNYKITYLPLSDNMIINHFINVTSSLIGVNSEFSIVPNDIKSMIFLIIGKIFIFSYVVSLIFNKLTDLIKR